MQANFRTGLKICFTCKVEKPLTSFSTDNSEEDKLSWRCKQCYSEWRRKHREQANQISKDSYQKNKEARKVYQKEWYIDNKEKFDTYQKEWLQSPQGKYRTYIAGAKTREILFDLSLDQFLTFWQKPCVYGCPISTICLDRINSDQGYTITNIQPMCEQHNRMKNSYTPDQFVELCLKVVQQAVKTGNLSSRTLLVEEALTQQNQENLS